MKLRGEVAIITGGGRGLGRASAILMAKEGASVVIASRTVSELKETAQQIESFGGKVIYVKADISKKRDIDRIMDKTISKFGKIDILMNNAAVIGPVAPIYEVKESLWKYTIDTNLTGPYMLSRAVLPYMIRHRKGKIINVTSGLGLMVMPLFGVYSITKAGLIHLTKVMAEELRDYNIQVNGLDPGVMDTKMQKDVRDLGPNILGEEIYREFLSLDLKPPQQVARLALFLASSESDRITGENGTETYYKRLGYDRSLN